MNLLIKNSLAGLKAIRNQSLIYNAVFLLGVNVLPAAVGFAYWGIASRLYSVADIGFASAVISATGLVAGLAGPGFNLGIVRFLPESAQPVRFLNTTYSAIFLLSIMGGGIYLAGIDLWSPSLGVLRQNISAAIGFILFVLAINWGAVLRETFTARRKSDYSFWYTLIANFSRLILVFFGIRYGAVGLLLSVAIGYWLALGISWGGFLPRIEKGYQFKPVWDWDVLKTIIPFSFGNYIANLLGQLSQSIFPIMNLEILGAELAGLAYIPLMLSGIIVSPGLAVAMSAFAEGASKPENSHVMFRKAVLLSLSLTIGVAVISIITAPALLRIFGSAFIQQSTVLFRWLAVAALPSIINQLFFSWLRIKKRIFLLTTFSGSVAILSILFSYMLIPYVGITANGMGMFIGNLLVMIPLSVFISLRWKIFNKTA